MGAESALLMWNLSNGGLLLLTCCRVIGETWLTHCSRCTWYALYWMGNIVVSFENEYGSTRAYLMNLRSKDCNDHWDRSTNIALCVYQTKSFLVFSINESCQDVKSYEFELMGLFWFSNMAILQPLSQLSRSIRECQPNLAKLNPTYKLNPYLAQAKGTLCTKAVTS